MDFSTLADRIPVPPKHLVDGAVEFWLTPSGSDPSGMARECQTLLEAQGWRLDYAERFDFYFRNGPRELRLQINPNPTAWCRLSGEFGAVSYEGPAWPDEYEGRVILEVIEG